jgi:Outer membrane protein beta-barrel domain
MSKNKFIRKDLRMKKMLLIALATSALSMPQLALAQSAFDGINLQLGLGFSSLGNEAGFGNSDLVIKTSQQNTMGSVAVGYSHGFKNKFNLASNVFYNIGSDDAGSISSTETGLGANATISSKVQNVWGISVEPGYYLSDNSLSFIKLGWVTATAKIDTNQRVLNIGNSSGFMYGLGFKHMLVNNLYIGIEAYQASFSSVSSTFNGTNISSKPNLTYGGLTVGYKF